MGHKATKSKLLARRLGSKTVATEVGDLVVRALNREEARQVAAAKDQAERDRRLLSLGIVDPELTADDVDAWSAAAPAGELEDVSLEIAKLSKMMPDDPKEQYKSFRE